MINWINHVLERLRSSLWFVPGLMSVTAALAAFLCARLDQTAAHSDFGLEFLYHGDPESARTVLSTVAGSMITVAGVAFSVTIGRIVVSVLPAGSAFVIQLHA